MATIRKRGERWQAQVRLQGHPPISKSFLLKTDAEAWARQQEVGIERGEIESARKSLKGFVLLDLLCRYEAEVSAKKRGAASERYRLKTLKAASIADTRLRQSIALNAVRRIHLRHPAAVPTSGQYQGWVGVLVWIAPFSRAERPRLPTRAVGERPSSSGPQKEVGRWNPACVLGLIVMRTERSLGVLLFAGVFQRVLREHRETQKCGFLGFWGFPIWRICEFFHSPKLGNGGRTAAIAAVAAGVQAPNLGAAAHPRARGSLAFWSSCTLYKLGSPSRAREPRSTSLQFAMPSRLTLARAGASPPLPLLRRSCSCEWPAKPCPRRQSARRRDDGYSAL